MTWASDDRTRMDALESWRRELEIALRVVEAAVGELAADVEDFAEALRSQEPPPRRTLLPPPPG